MIVRVGFPLALWGKNLWDCYRFRDDAVRFGFSIFSLPTYQYTGGDKNAAKKLLEKDIKWGYACINQMWPLTSMYMEIDYGTTMVYSNSDSLNFGAGMAEAVYTTTVDSVTPYIVLGHDLKKVKLVGPLSKNSSRDTDGDGLTDSQEINWAKYQMMTLYDFLGYTNQVGILSELSTEKQDEFRKTKIYPAFSNPTMADSDGDGFFDGITEKYEPTGYYKVADKWPLTDKPHPAFYQKGGEYYFNVLDFPDTYVGGRPIEDRNPTGVYSSKKLDLSKEEQKYIYTLCSILNSDQSFSAEISPLLIMAICAHETNCNCIYNTYTTDVMGYMQTNYIYVDAYCEGGQWDDIWLKNLRLEVSNWTNVTQGDFNILAEKADKTRIDGLLKDNPFVNIMFGTSFLYQHCINYKDMWNGLGGYCGDNYSPLEDTYYTEILAKLIREEVPYDKDEPYKGITPDYRVIINGFPVPLELPQR